MVVLAQHIQKDSLCGYVVAWVCLVVAFVTAAILGWAVTRLSSLSICNDSYIALIFTMTKFAFGIRAIILSLTRPRYLLQVQMQRAWAMTCLFRTTLSTLTRLRLGLVQAKLWSTNFQLSRRRDLHLLFLHKSAILLTSLDKCLRHELCFLWLWSLQILCNNSLDHSFAINLALIDISFSSVYDCTCSNCVMLLLHLWLLWVEKRHHLHRYLLLHSECVLRLCYMIITARCHSWVFKCLMSRLWP